MTALDPALVAWIHAAATSRLTYAQSWFFLDGVSQPEHIAHTLRDLVFRGLLVRDDDRVEATARGRQHLTAGTR